VARRATKLDEDANFRSNGISSLVCVLQESVAGRRSLSERLTNRSEREEGQAWPANSMTQFYGRISGLSTIARSPEATPAHEFYTQLPSQTENFQWHLTDQTRQGNDSLIRAEARWERFGTQGG
jgi:hypothetical protein